MPVYQCADCPRAFARRDNYRRHRRARHGGELSYQTRAVCGNCWAIFLRHDTCQRHINSCHSRDNNVLIHTYYQIPCGDWPEFEATNLATASWFDVPDGLDVATQQFRDWAIYYSDPRNSLQPPTLDSIQASLAAGQELARNTVSTLANSTNAQVIAFSDDWAYLNTNNHSNEDPDTSSDLEDHSDLVTSTLVVPSTYSATAFADLEDFPPSTNPSPPPSVGGPTFDFDLDDCQQLADILDQYGDNPPLSIEGQSSGIQTRLVLGRARLDTVEEDVDNDLPDLNAF
jgi:hypothetical protein